MGGQILDGLLVLALLEHQAGAHEGQVQDHVDLVEGEPVLHQALVAGEEHAGEVLVEVDELAVAPTAVFLDEVDGAIEVRDRDVYKRQRKDNPRYQLVVEGQICHIKSSRRNAHAIVGELRRRDRHLLQQVAPRKHNHRNEGNHRQYHTERCHEPPQLETDKPSER